MNYNISYKMPDGSQPKYKKIGKIKDGQYGPYMNICIEEIEFIIAQARADGKLNEFKGKHYLNISMFEDTGNNNQNISSDQNNNNPKDQQVVQIDDEIPF